MLSVRCYCEEGKMQKKEVQDNTSRKLLLWAVHDRLEVKSTAALYIYHTFL